MRLLLAGRCRPPSGAGSPRPGTSRSARRSARAGARAGFTLAELLLAATLGALLLLATATASGTFGRQMSELQEDQGASLEGTLEQVADAVRYAWWVDVPSTRRLVVTDPDGHETSWQFSDGKLLVTRPNGLSGLVLEDLQSASFSAESTKRYREDAPTVRNGTLWSASAPLGGTPTALLLEDGDALALGFCPAAAAPINASPVAGVTEQLVQANLGTVAIAMAGVPPIAGNVTIDLYRARAPDDPRPVGASLGQSTLAVSALPTATTQIIDLHNGHIVKHVPGGNAWGWWKNYSQYQFTIFSPTSSVSLDLASLNAVVKPGRAYTVVVRMSGTGGVAVETYPVATAGGSGVARSVAGGAFSEQPLAVPRSLSGLLTMTKTTATDVVRRVAIAFTGTGGQELSGTATVIGQSMADDPWLGVVPGETDP